MKLANRLSLAATAVIMGTALTISLTALNAAEESEVASLDSQISSVIDAGLAQGADKLQAVSSSAEQSGAAITVAFITFEGDITILNESQVTFRNAPTDGQLRSSLIKSVRVEGSETYLMKSLSYSENEYVVVATSLNAVIENKSQNSRRFIVFTFLSSAIGAVVVWLLIRRDVRVINKLINQANDIADGVRDVSLPEPRGSTEVSELTVALTHMIESLKENQTRMENFLGDSSHELRTPLSVIRGYVELLQANISDEQRDRAFARLQSEILRMESLISDLLILSELTSSGSFIKVPVNFSEILLTATHDLETLHPNRKVDAQIENDVVVPGDERLLNQLVSNIFGNIIRHTSPNDPVQVSLGLDNSEVSLVVEDGGPGLSDDAYAQGPTFFQRYEKSRSRATGGSGLGMSMIVAIVESHNGNVRFTKSNLGGLRIQVKF